MNFSEILEKRRAYRSLEPVQISDDMIISLAHAPQIMPSCFNNQPWRYIFVREEPELSLLKTQALSKGNVWATPASMIIAVISKPDLDCVIKDREYYQFDTGMGTAALILKATEMGLVAHPIAGYSPEKVHEILKIPEEFKVITLIIVGKKRIQPTEYLSEDQKSRELERPKRLAIEDFIYHNRFSS